MDWKYRKELHQFPGCRQTVFWVKWVGSGSSGGAGSGCGLRKFFTSTILTCHWPGCCWRHNIFMVSVIQSWRSSRLITSSESVNNFQQSVFKIRKIYCIFCTRRQNITKTVQNECGSFIFIAHFYFPRVCWTFYLGTSIYLFARRWKLWQNVPKSFPERIPIIHFWLNTHPQTSPLGAWCSHQLQRRPRWLLETLRKCFCTFL